MILYSGKRFRVIICSFLLILLAPQILSAQNAEGYWKFSDQRSSHLSYREWQFSEEGKQPLVGGPNTIRIFADPSYTGIAEWGQIPDVLIPGREYVIPYTVRVHRYQETEDDYPPLIYGGISVEEGGSMPTVIANWEMRGDPPKRVKGQLPSRSDHLVFKPPVGFPAGRRTFTMRVRAQIQVWRGPDVNEFAGPIYHIAYNYEWFDAPLPEEETHNTIRATATPREVRPDGESTVDISATLYEYIPGDDASSTPLAGETLTFEISEIEGIRPGRLSSATAVTDGDGIALVTYTSPKANELKKLEEFRRHNITVKVRSEKHNVEDLAYITISPQRGKAFIEPSIDGLLGTTYGGSRGIVPPDGRFPALIRAVLEDENMEPLVHAEATVTIMSENPVGMLRSPEGVEAITLDLVTDDRGNIEVHYFYALETLPEVPVKETIQITSDFMTTPLEVEVTVGLNIVIDNVESGYEGRGTVSAGEEIPLRIRVKDVWNPDIDLSEIITYWGLGDGTGDTRLFIRLEIDNISSIPEYIMDHLRQTFYPEPPIDEHVEIISSDQLAQKNLLWVPDYSLLPYRGYPRVRPVATGNHYYEARISLVDHHGEVVFETDYPAAKGFFNLHTDMPADEIYLYFVNNPLRPQTEEAEYLAIVLGYLGGGCVVSVVDAFDAINRGDTETLFGIMFSEIRGFIVDQGKEMSPDFKKMMTWYGRLSLAGQIYDQASTSTLLDPDGLEESLMRQLEGVFADDDGQLVILLGSGDQELLEFPAYEGRLHYDAEQGVASLKVGERSYYIVRPDMELTSKTAQEMIIY